MPGATAKRGIRSGGDCGRRSLYSGKSARRTNLCLPESNATDTLVQGNDDNIKQCRSSKTKRVEPTDDILRLYVADESSKLHRHSNEGTTVQGYARTFKMVKNQLTVLSLKCDIT